MTEAEYFQNDGRRKIVIMRGETTTTSLINDVITFGVMTAAAVTMRIFDVGTGWQVLLGIMVVMFFFTKAYSTFKGTGPIYMSDTEFIKMCHSVSDQFSED